MDSILNLVEMSAFAGLSLFWTLCLNNLLRRQGRMYANARLGEGCGCQRNEAMMTRYP